MKASPPSLAISGPSIPTRERRTDPRAGADLRVDVLENGFAHHCRIVDISLSGMAIELTKTLAILGVQEISIFEVHANAKVLTIKGRAAWRHGAIQAVHFIDVHDAERIALAEIVDAVVRAAVSDVERLELAELRDRLFKAAHRPLKPLPIAS